MLSLNKLSVRAKLIAAFGTLSFMMLTGSGLSMFLLNGTTSRFADYINGTSARSHAVTEVQSAASRRAIATLNLVIATSMDDIQTEQKNVQAAQSDLTSALKTLNELSQGSGTAEQAKTLIKDINAQEQAYEPVGQALVQMALESRRAEAAANLNANYRPVLNKLMAALNAYSSHASKQGAATVASEATRDLSERLVLLAASAAALVIAAIAGIWITRGLTRQLGAEPGALSKATERFADGDLTPIEGGKNAPEGSVLSSIDKMQHSLGNLVEQVRQAALNISTGSTEIANGNLDLSQRTEKQASALQQTAATMEELNATVRNNADNARQVESLAVQANMVASEGGRSVAEMVKLMHTINEGSRKITDITSTIDSIAFQTNILALNAAVEAARAGEHGRGFAVVASEVRSLSQRCAGAAGEIKKLITESAEQVRKGSTVADQAGMTMKDVVAAVAQVAEKAGAISTASDEQSRAVSEVGQAVTLLDHNTQQNAALVEESAAAAEGLQRQAQQLVESVSVFRLTEAA